MFDVPNHIWQSMSFQEQHDVWEGNGIAEREADMKKSCAWKYEQIQQ